ncbi:glycosyltransferase [Salinarimonas sp.]|uniref:glycosyltransferase n=1 Tax=Salinarimonas sp. TaxID=2766526 RepID=UPI0032D97991
MTSGAQPLISIVTPVLDRAEMLREALASARSSEPDLIEHVVVDGGSSDGSADVARELGSRATVLVASGSGIYDALEIGVAHARGRYVGFLNSDDIYANGALDAVIAAIRAEPVVELLSGQAFVFDDGGGPPVPTGGRAERLLSPRALARGPIAINARFFARGLLARLGGFDPGLRISADREFLIRVARAQPSHVLLERPLYLYRRHAGSCTLGGDRGRAALTAREHLALFGGLVGGGPLPRSWRRAFLDAAAVETARLAFAAPRDALSTLREGVRRDPLLLPRVVAAAAGAASRRAARRFTVSDAIKERSAR